MERLLRTFNSLHYHYSLSGFDGIRFLLKTKYNENKLIGLKIRGYKHIVYLRNGTSDIPMFYYIFQEREYDFNFDFEPKVIIDCGAHIGLGAIFFANKFPNALIYSVEPEKTNFEILLKNTKGYPNIKCLNYGVWNKTTNLKIVDTGLGNWGFMTEEVDYQDENTVEAISIQEIMKRHQIDNIDICKINIEGTEKELFAQNFEKWLPKTKAIIIELHDRMREGCTKSFFNALTNYDFSLYPSGSYLVCILK